MKYLKLFSTKEEAAGLVLEAPFVGVVDGKEGVVYASLDDYEDGLEIVLTDDFIKVKHIYKIIFKVEGQAEEVIYLPDTNIGEIEITANQPIQSVTASDGTFTLTSKGELKYKLNKNYIMSATTTGTIDNGSGVANMVNPDLSNYAWYKYDLTGNDDWGCWSTSEMAIAAGKYYGMNGGPKTFTIDGEEVTFPAVDWSHFTWKESYMSYDGKSVYNMNPYGASTVRSGYGFGTHEVGLKLPNWTGLYDMTGNVSEWCDDSPEAFAASSTIGGSFANNPSKMYVNDWVSDGNGDNFYPGMRVATKTNVGLTNYESLIRVNGLYVGKYNITKDLWASVMADNAEGVSTAPSKWVSGNVFKADQTLITGFNDDGTPITESIDWKFGEPIEGEHDNLRPVENITKFDAMYFCNVYSASKSLSAYYTLSDVVVENGHITSATVSRNETANGFRLLTKAEWTAAATNSGQDYAGCNKAGSIATCYPYYDPSLVSEVTFTATVVFEDGETKVIEKTVDLSNDALNMLSE